MRLDVWAEELKMSLERDVKDLDREIKEARRGAMAGLTLQEKLEGQKRVRSLEAARNQKRRSLFDAQDEIDERRGQLIAELEAKLEQNTEWQAVFVLRWRVV